MNTTTIVIGRNEGPRLIACLTSLQTQTDRIVYVDSGSTDGSLEAARSTGAVVVELDMSKAFTAARARNAGRAAAGDNAAEYLQFVDGDCQVFPDWLMRASNTLKQAPQAAIVFGHIRELHPEDSIYNKLCSIEWDTPLGSVKYCPGIAMIRTSAFDAAGGFKESLIAGEEPELCVRLRQSGWEIHKIDVDMVLHDAAITRFSQWWKRAKRAGYAFAEGAALHGALPERHWVEERNRALFWGLALPFIIISCGLFWWPMFLLFLIYPIQVTRLALKRRFKDFAWTQAFLGTASKLAEAQGALQYYWRRILQREHKLIEYK